MQESGDTRKAEVASSATGRREIINHALGLLPWESTPEEKGRAIEQARENMRKLGPEATEAELIHAATQTVRRVADDCAHRVRRERWLNRVSNFLPWGALGEDKNDATEVASEMLEDLPLKLSDWEIEQKIRETLAPICKKIERRRKRYELIEHGRSRLGTLLWELHEEEVISSEEWLDSSFRSQLEQVVIKELQHELTGSEDIQGVDDLVESIVADELDLEFDEDELDEEG